MQRGACAGPPPHPVDKPPKDGVGPRGKPECYYTSRVLNSTFRYVKFVKKLRATEEEERKGAENKLKELKDKQISDFFIRCDRRALINNVARRVDLCMVSYEADLQEKRQRLKDLYAAEEEANIRKFTEQVQAGVDSVWQDKLDRLQYLIEKRKREHAAKYKDIPLAKCADINTQVFKMRAKECQQIQLYQMKEKQARRMSEMEFDKLWYAVAMKEADALKARMEIDAIEAKRKNLLDRQFTENLLEQRKIDREKEKERLKEESRWFRALWDAEIKKEEEAERQRAEKRKETARERDKMIQERKQTLERLQSEDKLINDTWDSLAGQGLADEANATLKRRQKAKETNECNKEMIQLKNEIAVLSAADDDLFAAEAAAIQRKLDEKRCEYNLWAQKTNREVRQAMIDQIKEREHAREALQAKIAEQDEYSRQLSQQLGALVDHKTMVDARTRKEHQRQLLAQIEYNQLLKERARQEELEQLKKAKLATEEYHEVMKNMLTRKYFSDHVHPFLRQMDKGMEMKEKCPCSKPDYCK